MKPLWNHQIEAIKRSEDAKNFALFFEQGTGKTRTTIECLRRKFASKNRLMKTVIFCPIIVCENWKQEFLMYSKVNPKDILILNSTGAKRIKEFTKAIGESMEFPKIVITNYHSVGMKQLFELFKQYQFEIVVCDESQRTKNPKGMMAKAVMQLADLATNKYLLSGTPVLNSPMDLFMQYRILDGGETFGKNYYGFKYYYCKDENAIRAGKPGYFPKWVVRPEMLPIISDKINPTSMRVLKSECLDLPPLVRQEIYVELSAEQKRMYEEMKKEYIAFLDDMDKSDKPKTITAQIAATKALRLQQIVSGYAQIEQSGESIELKDVPRLKALSELLEDLAPDHKVIVWCMFKQNYKAVAKVCEALKLKYTEIHGEISTKDKQTNMENFRKDKDVRVMIANQAAGGTGVNLVEASYSIYYSKGFSLEADLQSEARNHRSGSEMHEKITRIDLVARGYIDDIVNEALKNKQNVAEAVLQRRNNL